MGVAVVTGGASGIGLAISDHLLQAGFDVAIVSLEAAEAIEPSLERLRRRGRLAYRRVDVADTDGHAALVRDVESELGPIECLVNNAGVTSLTRGDLLDLSVESFDRCLAVNLRGAFFLAQRVARAMIESARSDRAPVFRSIVNITSANAEILGVDRADYCISKAALSMATRLFAARLAGEGIPVFEIRPGIVRTAMTAPAAEKYDRVIEGGGVPIARWGDPEDVGRVVAVVARGMIPYATGEAIRVDGGLHLHRL